MTIEERLERLEGELGRARRFNRWLLAAVVLTAGVWLLAAFFQGEQARAQTTKPGSDSSGVIRAKAFVVEDEKGKARAQLDATKDGAGLSLYDEKGKPRAQLDATKDGAWLSLYDEKGKPRAQLTTTKDGAGLYLYDGSGNNRAILGVAGTKGRDGTTVKHPESAITLFNPDGTVVWQSPR